MLNHKAFAGSAVWFVISRGLDEYRSCLISGLLGLSPGPCKMMLRQGLFQDTQLSVLRVDLYQVHEQVDLPPGPWEDFC